MKRFILSEVRELIKQADDPLCAYCCTSVHNTGQPLTFDHILPIAKGGTNEFDNLCRACRQCNEAKGDKTEGVDPMTGLIVSLFHPRQQLWQEHFYWDETGVYLVGLTAIGRATIASLNMNNETILFARRRWVDTGWHPPIR